MNRRTFLQLCAGSVASASLGCPGSTFRPNILYIFVDDMGIGDLSCYGSPDIQTPNIDRIASGGVRFTRAYSGSPLCGPSRACLMTGRHQAALGSYFNPPVAEAPVGWGVPHDIPNVGEILQNNGYSTCYIGKWHQGHDPSQHPNVRGFDHFYGSTARPYHYQSPFWQGYPDYFQTERNGVLDPTPGYVTDLYTDEAIDWIGSLSPSTPWCMCLAHFAPHAPFYNPDIWQVPPEYQSGHAHIADTRRRDYANTVAALDYNIGRLLDYLESSNQMSETLIVFASDNGGVDFLPMTNGALRGSKASMYEGGIRGPLIMRFDGVIEPGIERHDMVTLVDVVPTIAKMTKAPATVFDGADLRGYILGYAPQPPHDAWFWTFHSLNHDQVAMVQLRDDGHYWKRMVNVNFNIHELYDLTSDPSETTNVYSQQPAVASEMLTAINIFRPLRAPAQWYPGGKDIWEHDNWL